MAAKAESNVKPDTPFGTAPMLPIEQYEGRNGIRASVHHGAMVMAGWCAGKMVTAAEYDAAIKAFLKSSAGKG